MRAIKTTTISILTIGLLAGSAVGVAAQDEGDNAAAAEPLFALMFDLVSRSGEFTGYGDIPAGTVTAVGAATPTPTTTRLSTRRRSGNPATDNFMPAASLAENRAAHTATLLPDGRVLVIGGNRRHVPSPTEIWDPATASFGPAGSPAKERDFHTATLLSDGRVLVVGGWDENSDGVHDSAEVWDPSDG